MVRWLERVEAPEEEGAGGEEERAGKVDTRGRGVAAVKVEEGPAREDEGVEDMEEAVEAGVEVEGVEAWAFLCLPYLGLVTDEQHSY